MRKLLFALLLAPAIAAADYPNPLISWASANAPAAATQATASIAASPGVRHVATHLTVCVSAVAAQSALVFNLRDGASGAGTVLWTATLSGAAGTTQCVVAPVHIVGSAGIAMTLQSAAAPAATNSATVSIAGYDYR